MPFHINKRDQTVSFSLFPVIARFLANLWTLTSSCHPSILNELTNVLSFPSFLVFDDSQKRQVICSSRVIPRNAFAFRQGIYDVFIIWRSLDDFAFSKIKRWHYTSERWRIKKGALADAFFTFLHSAINLPCVINFQTGGYRIIAGTIGVIAPNIAV